MDNKIEGISYSFSIFDGAHTIKCSNTDPTGDSVLLTYSSDRHSGRTFIRKSKELARRFDEKT